MGAVLGEPFEKHSVIIAWSYAQNAHTYIPYTHICVGCSHIVQNAPIYGWGGAPLDDGGGREGPPRLPCSPRSSLHCIIWCQNCQWSLYFCVFVFLYLYLLIHPDTQHPNAKSCQCSTFGIYVSNACMDICIFNIVKDWAMACFYLLADSGPFCSAM